MVQPTDFGHPDDFPAARHSMLGGVVSAGMGHGPAVAGLRAASGVPSSREGQVHRRLAARRNAYGILGRDSGRGVGSAGTEITETLSSVPIPFEPVKIAVSGDSWGGAMQTIPFIIGDIRLP